MESTITTERMKRCVQAGPSERRHFREHLLGCEICRLTQYSGLRPSQHFLFSRQTDCGTLCDVGFRLFIAPDLLRESADRRSKRLSTEGVMRAMGFDADWSGAQ